VAGDSADKTVKASKKALIRKEMDVNFDQRIDIVQYYSGEPSKEVMIREEMDSTSTAGVTRPATTRMATSHARRARPRLRRPHRHWSYYQLTTSEDGKPVNRLIERRRDNDGDGVIDVWEYYTKAIS